MVRTVEKHKDISTEENFREHFRKLRETFEKIELLQYDLFPLFRTETLDLFPSG